MYAKKGAHVQVQPSRWSPKRGAHFRGATLQVYAKREAPFPNPTVKVFTKHISKCNLKNIQTQGRCFPKSNRKGVYKKRRPFQGATLNINIETDAHFPSPTAKVCTEKAPITRTQSWIEREKKGAHFRNPIVRGVHKKGRPSSRCSLNAYMQKGAPTFEVRP